MEEMVGYIYKTTNLVNGKIYIGQHQNRYPDRDYFGSGRALISALKKYGKNNFIVAILYWAKTVEELNRAEIDFIRAYGSTNKVIGYNISLGGELSTKGMKYSEEHRRKLSESHMGKPSHMKGRHLTEETKMKMRESLRGKRAWNKGLLGFMKGRKCSDETRKRMSESSIGKPGTRNGAVVCEETKRKLSESNKGKHGGPPWNKGIRGIPWSRARRDAQDAKKNNEINGGAKPKGENQ